MSALLLLAAVASHTAARADEPPSDAEVRAQRLFDEAIRLLEEGSFKQACDKLSESHSLDPAGGTALNLAFCQEKRGLLATSLAAYELALQRAIGDGRQDREERARARIADLELRTARVRIRVAPAFASSSGARVLLDGRELTASELATAVPVDPGKHVVVATAPGAEPIRREVSVQGEGEIADVSIDRLVAPAPGVGRRAAAPEGARRQRETATGGSRGLALGLGASGLALTTVGVVTGVLAANAHSESDELCKDGCSQAGVDAEHRANALAWVSNGTFAGAVGLLGVATYLLLTAPSRSGNAPSPPARSGSAFVVSF